MGELAFTTIPTLPPRLISRCSVQAPFALPSSLGNFLMKGGLECNLPMNQPEEASKRPQNGQHTNGYSNTVVRFVCFKRQYTAIVYSKAPYGGLYRM